MRSRPKVILIVIIIGAVGFSIFLGLAQTQLIFVPYLTTTSIHFEGLQDTYVVNGSMDYIIYLRGYGSNCIAFEAGIFREKDQPSSEEERVAYYSQTQDCRKIDISQGQYNYTKSFSYSGNTVLGEPGNYRVDVNVLDQGTGRTYSEKRSFIVEEQST